MGEKRLDIKTGFLCNNNCKFCVQAHKKRFSNRTTSEIKRDIKKSRKACSDIVFTGGEVTLREDVLELVAYAKELGYKHILMQTNGRMLSYMDFCKAIINAGANIFSPALHGHNAKIHEFLTRCKGSFNQTVEGIKNLKRLGQPVVTNTVVVKPNYRYLPEIAKLLVKLRVDQFQFAFVHPMGNAYKYFDSMVPRMSLVAPYIHKGLQVGIDAGIRVMSEAMPYCMMKGYEKYIVEERIPATEIRDITGLVPDFEWVRKHEGKLKFPQCKKCQYDSVCEGPWREYPERFGNKEFKPVEKIPKTINSAKEYKKQLAIGYSSKCNNNCGHCITRPAFPKDIKMTLDTAKDLILQAKSIGVGGVSFTVGEPFSYAEDIKKLVQFCNNLGIRTRIVTNAFWASTPKISDKYVKELIRAGLTELRISCSRFHQKNIKLQNVINAANSCFRNNLHYFISFILYLPKEDKHIEKRLKDNNLNYRRQYLTYFGKASKLKKLALAHEDTIKKCELTPAITPDLKVYACCGAGGYFSNTNFFCLGDLRQSSLSDIYMKLDKNRLFRLIESIGLDKLAKLAGFDKETLKLRRCDLCEKLFNSKANIKKLNKALKDV